MKFKGGYTFGRFEGSAESSLKDTGIPENIFLPTSFIRTRAIDPRLQSGERVVAGQVVIHGEQGAPGAILSPVNGKVERVDESGIRIVSDETSDFLAVPGHPRAPWKMDPDALLALFHNTGCSLLIPGAAIESTSASAFTTIIVNAVRNLPLARHFDPVVFGTRDLVAKGFRVLNAMFPNARTTLAINRRTREFFDTAPLNKHAGVRIMSDKYPQESYALLSRDIAGEKLYDDAGRRTPGIILLDYTDVVHIAETMSQGRPFVDRIIQLAGPGVSRPAWYRFRIGTPYRDIVTKYCKENAHGPWRVIRGNLFTGNAVDIDEAVVLPTDHEITVIREQTQRNLFRFMVPGFELDSYSRATVSEFLPVLPKRLDSGVHGGSRYCVQCNYCQDVCPVDIYPHLIWKYVDAKNPEGSFRLRPQDCIGCGICDYVCPSKIDISSGILSAKDAYYASMEKE